MEEASLDCDITTLLSLYFSGSRWMRFAFCARVTGLSSTVVCVCVHVRKRERETYIHIYAWPHGKI